MPMQDEGCGEFDRIAVVLRPNKELGTERFTRGHGFPFCRRS
jgi:hypothetical protein